MLTIAVRWPRNLVITTINNIHKFCVCIIYNNDMSHRFVSSFVSLINGQTGIVMLKCSRQLKMIEFTALLELKHEEFVWQMTVVWFWFQPCIKKRKIKQCKKQNKEQYETNKKGSGYLQIAMDYLHQVKIAVFFNAMLFTLSANSYRLYSHYVKIARFSAIYTTYCK